MDEAYREWHEELVARVAEEDQADTKTNHGVINLTQIHPTGSVQFYSNAPTRLTSLIREEHALAQARVEMRLLREEIKRTEETHGHAPVTLAIGSVTWSELPESTKPELWAQSYEATGELRLEPAQWQTLEQPVVEPLSEMDTAETEASDEAADSPEVIVVNEPALHQGVRLQFPDHGDAFIQLTDKIDVNPAIIRALRKHGAPADALADLRQLATESTNTEVVVTRLSELGRMYLPGYHFESRSLLGSFSRPARTMLADLEAMEPYIRTSGIMLALAGDDETRRLSAAPLPPGREEDRSPAVERGVGDQDPRELSAVEAVASGRSLVLDCPPGSRRLETLTSIVADSAASGRSVLVIPSRASAGQALIAELEKRGLGELAVDFTDVETVPRRLRTGMRLTKPEIDVDATMEIRNELAEVRAKLERFIGELHDKSDEWDLSVHDLLEKLAAATLDEKGPRTRVRLSAQTLQQISNDGLDTIREQLVEAGTLQAFDPSVAKSAWANSTISEPAQGSTALDEAHRLADITIPAAIGQSSRSAGETGLTQARTLNEWFEQIDVLDGIAESLDTFLPQIFETSAMNMVIATASKEWREANGHSMKQSERRRLRKQALDLVRPGVTPKDLHGDLQRVQDRRQIWRRYSSEGGWPRLPDGMSQIRASKEEIERDIDSLSSALGGEDLRNLEFDALQDRLAALINDAEHMSTLPQRNAVLSVLRDKGLGALLDDVIARNVPAEKVPDEFELAYSASIFEQLIRKSPTLAELGPRDLGALLEDLDTLDREHIASLPAPIMRAVVNNARGIMQDRRADTLKLDELLGRYGVSALRDVIATYARIVQAARPVWIVPPTVAAEFIPPMPWADLAIVEVADGDSVASVISPLMRGRQAVVVGDTRRAKLVERNNGVVSSFARILPTCELPTNRSLLDPLAIRALSDHGYADVIADVPSLKSLSTASLTVVDGRGVPSQTSDGAVDAPKAEVDAVVDAVVEHALTRPDESLAVITISPLHAHRIRETLRDMRVHSAEIEAAFAGVRGEPLAIVDLSGVNGLRRDRVIFSVGFGKTVHGRVLHSFGQLATPAGLSGLIDTIEAARGELSIISSMAPGEILEDRVSTPGPRLLAEILRYAGDDGGLVAKPASLGTVSPLIADLAHRLQSAGFEVAPNYGFTGGLRMALAVGHHTIPGTWAVAVLVDDQNYVRQPSLRRRDRYRAQALRDRGWIVVETFSTSLFIDPQGQAKHIGNKVKTAMRDLGITSTPEAEVKTSVKRNDAPAFSAQKALRQPSQPAKVEPRRRFRRPDVVPGLQLAGYTDDQIEDMITWIASDGIARDEAEFVEQIREELGLRKGGQIDRVLGNIVRRSGLVGVSVDPVADALGAQNASSNRATPVASEEHSTVQSVQVQAEPPASRGTEGPEDTKEVDMSQADPDVSREAGTEEFDYEEQVEQAMDEGMVYTEEVLEADPHELVTDDEDLNLDEER